MTINREQLLEAVEHETPILNNSDELTEDAMNAIFNEMAEDPVRSVMTPLISRPNRVALASNLQKKEVVLYKSTCSCCAKQLEFKLSKTSIVTRKFPLYQDLGQLHPDYCIVPEVDDIFTNLTKGHYHNAYKAHTILIERNGETILCADCYHKKIRELEDEIEAFLNGDVLSWAQDCNDGKIEKEGQWKKMLFTLWKVHKKTQRLVEFRIDKQYDWLDQNYKNEVNEAFPDSYSSEREYWKPEDIPAGCEKKKRLSRKQKYTVPFEGPYNYSTPFGGSIESADDPFGPDMSKSMNPTKEYIEKVCHPCHNSPIDTSEAMMKYVLRAEGVDLDAVMRHNRFLIYEDFLRTPYWYNVSQRVKWAAGFKCSNCGSKNDLHVHHLTYDHKGIEAKYPEDLICLCGKCHREAHEITPFNQDDQAVHDFGENDNVPF